MTVLVAGCGSEAQTQSSKSPRPVHVQTLRQQTAPAPALVTASVGAWKTEKLAFEVGGRVKVVVDQNTMIDGRVYDLEGNQVSEGKAIAQIESERYELNVATSKASVARAEQSLMVGQTELNESIPAQIDAARASMELTKIEYERNKRLVARNAGSQSDLDSAKASYEN
ncbi:MAG: hypothetical protein AAFU85_31345, partial [Planctomycetota bacterium]